MNEALKMVKSAQEMLRNVQRNWETCMFDCDEYLTLAIRLLENKRPPQTATYQIKREVKSKPPISKRSKRSILNKV